MIVTIKNEDPVELVLNSTCESSCFLVTKIFNKIWCFYFLQSSDTMDVHTQDFAFAHLYSLVSKSHHHQQHHGQQDDESKKLTGTYLEE